MQLLTTKNFNGVAFNCYKAENEEDGFWATREQIGRLLEYADPSDAIAKIHRRNKERLDKYSRGGQSVQSSGGIQSTTVYNFMGFLEICRFSNQPKADAVMDFAWSVMNEIRKTGSYGAKSLSVANEIMPIAERILSAAGITGNQLALALDKTAKHYTGVSMLELSGVQLKAPVQEQILNPTQIGKIMGGVKPQKVNEILAGMGFQHKIAGKWEALEPGKPYAVMLDVGKKHSDGTPVRHLHWNSSVIKEIKNYVELTGTED